MTEEVIKNIPGVLGRHLCTMKKASYDESNAEYMSDSSLKVINFDKIPAEYLHGKGWANMPTSNDALYISTDQNWYFIEFKNGSIDKAVLYRKIYDSFLILIDMGMIPDIQFVRDHIQYILVYNSEKYPLFPVSQNRDVNYSYIMRLSQREKKLFGVEKLEEYLLKETHTYTKELFEKNFVVPMEEQERIANA